MTLTETKSFCQICSACCGTKLTIDDSTGRVVKVRGDKDDLMSSGYACIKGLEAPAALYSDNRILEPLKRMADGSFQPIAFSTALDEVAAKLQDSIDRYGAESIAGFRGSGAVVNATAGLIVHNLLEAIGSHKSFSPYTIDQSAKNISAGRLGIWPPGRDTLRDSDMRMFFGINPLVSVLCSYLDMTNPMKRLKDARARGMKVIVIDPRRTETAEFADIFLQPYPGEDVSIAAGFIRIILKEGWEDKAFCADHVQDLEELRRAVEPFTPEYVANRAGVLAHDLWRAASLFAHESKRGGAGSGTGTNMAPHSNLAEHLIECLNVVCGRYLRAGDVFPNPSVLRPSWTRQAQVIPAQRWWEEGYKSRIKGYGTLTTTIGTKFGEMMTGIFADEILEPGEGQVRCVINNGSNIINIVPDQEKTFRALKSLDLLVSIEPYMNETARMSDYIFPTTLHYERPDLTHWMYAAEIMYSEPYARYKPAAVSPPAGAQVVDDWIVVWELAKRLGVQLVFDGIPLNMLTRPETDDLLRIIVRHAPISFDELKAMPLGKIFNETAQVIAAADPGNTGRFTTMPMDVAAELEEVLSERVEPGFAFSQGQRFTHRLTSRRLREVINSTGHDIPAIRRRMPTNYAYMNPEEMIDLGISNGEKVKISSDNGSIFGIARADPTLRRSVISMSHGWGGLPGQTNFETEGSNTGILISTDRDLDPINAMPRMSAIPVNVTRVAPQVEETLEALIDAG
jgi:anaerobic selenocysteine-containing dehydrogenase